MAGLRDSERRRGGSDGRGAEESGGPAAMRLETTGVLSCGRGYCMRRGVVGVVELEVWGGMIFAVDGGGILIFGRSSFCTIFSSGGVVDDDGRFGGCKLSISFNGKGAGSSETAFCGVERLDFEENVSWF